MRWNTNLAGCAIVMMMGGCSAFDRGGDDAGIIDDGGNSDGDVIEDRGMDAGGDPGEDAGEDAGHDGDGQVGDVGGENVKARLTCRQGSGMVWKVRTTPCLVDPNCSDLVGVTGEWDEVRCSALEVGCEESIPQCGDSLCEEGEDEGNCLLDCLVVGPPYHFDPGQTEIYGSLQFGGRERTYMFHVPACYNGLKATPLVIGLHGGGGTGEAFQVQLGLNAKSEEACFIAVYPDGVSAEETPGKQQHWNCGPRDSSWYPPIQDVDDVGFISTLIDAFDVDYNIDLSRVYATGLSNGAMMSYRLGCELSDKISAIAPIGGGLAAIDCSPLRPVSVLHIHGTDDRYYPFEGGYNCAYDLGIQDDFISVSDVIESGKQINQCADVAVVTCQNGEVTCETYSQCGVHAEATLCTVENGGHTVPGGYAFPSEKLMGVGKISRDVNSADAIWDFFERDAIYDMYFRNEGECIRKEWQKEVVQVENIPRKILWKGPAGPWTRGAIVALHGGGGTYSNYCGNLEPLIHELNRPMEEFCEAAISRGFAVFSLDSTHWLVGDEQGHSCGKRFDCLAQQYRPYIDLAFIENVITTRIPALRPAGSSDSIFMTGISNGGYTTILASTHFNDKITAFAPVSAGDPYGTHFDCTLNPGDRVNAPGRFLDNETGRPINESGACFSTDYPNELAWATANSDPMPAVKQFHHEGDAACDVSCMYKAHDLLLVHGYADDGPYVIENVGLRSVLKHLWQDEYNQPLLDFFESF